MSTVQTTLLDFSVDPKDVKNESQLSILTTNIENVLRDFLINLKLMSTFSLDGEIYKVYTGDMKSVVTLRIFNSGLITINIEYLKGENQDDLLPIEKYRQMEQNLRGCGIKRESWFAPIKRGTFCKYYITSDERLIEYDIDDLLFEERSPFQKVQVVHSQSLGNMLVLDDLQNIAEVDLIYTETLMAKGKESYKDKEIVILEEPKNVIMLEIDEVVIRACSKHMRSICGDVLDSRSGPNYQIIIGDCLQSLSAFHKEGQTFDYIFGDLTDVPITETSETWNFVKNYLELSFKILKPSGKFMTHGNGACCKTALQRFETYLSTLKPSLVVDKCQSFIPSFMEFWVFYAIRFAEQD
ncbi:hypothetical protein RN001_010635 [Aquatica leii]|uniref:PABS domain-containing protein n=1 Tax=Aquatica leii TaxID=1421715 RepID=A0AAN7SG60_9COLE|nr:hypothetical protein RN001_010635 [Aquatica leii]